MAIPPIPIVDDDDAVINNPPYQSTNVPQINYYSDQETFNLDFEALTQSFIQPIDNIRSHFNGLVNNNTNLNTPQYQESRCHTYYRMIGFPIVDPSNLNFYSPGYDPNLNTDAAGLARNLAIANNIVNNKANYDFVNNQLNPRENIPNMYSALWAAKSVFAEAVYLGSSYIRSFDRQFGSVVNPFALNKNQVQLIQERNADIFSFFDDELQSFVNDKALNSLLSSNHLLAPFVTDPRIDSSIRPIKNRIAAPFLFDKSQTKLFSGDYVQRPFIERVISVRFNNSNVMLNTGGQTLQDIINQINNNPNITDPNLVALGSNPIGQAYSSNQVIFQNYYKMVKIVIEELVDQIRQVQDIRQNINFQPIPDPKLGPESGLPANTLNTAIPNDPNNTQIENQIVQLQQKQIVNDAILDAGLQDGVPDPGDFAFSNIDDIVGDSTKNLKKSYQESISSLMDARDQVGNDGITALQNIEIIMGEFSGIGLIDMIAIQMALWILDPASTLGLIDNRARDRIKLRKDINVKNIIPNSIDISLENFQLVLANVYVLIQKYYDSLVSGSAYSI